MRCVYVLGTAGAGKSLLTSKLHEYYTSGGAFVSTLNLDPGVTSLPYNPDVDIRDFVDIRSIMEKYDLGPNGGLVMASDMAAARLPQMQDKVHSINPDFLLVDTPGQVELFAYRNSGPFITSRLEADHKACMFLYDGAMVSNAANFLSVSLLALSIRLRLDLPCLEALSKADLAGDVNRVMRWTEDVDTALDEAAGMVDGEMYSLLAHLGRGVRDLDYETGLIPVSSATGMGLADVAATISRMVNMGEEVED